MLKRNIAFGLLGQGLLLLLSLSATRFVFHELGAEVLGIISFSVTLTFMFILLSDMGMSLLITREVAAKRDQDAKYVEQLVGAVVAVSWTAFLVSAALALVLAPWLIDRWLQMETLDRASAVLALQMISVALLLAIPRAVYGAVLSGYERVDLWNVANVSAVSLQQIGLIAVLAAGGGLMHVAAWFCVSAILGILPFLYWVGRVGGVRLLRPRWGVSVLSRNLRFVAQLFANSLSGSVATQVDKWAISRFLPVSQLGFYGFAHGLASKGGIVPGAIANAAFPALSSMTVHGGEAWRAQYDKLQDFTSYVYFPVVAAVAMLGIVVIRLVFNAEVVELLWLPLLLLSIGQYLLGLLNIPNWLAIAVKRPDIALRANLWALAIVIPPTVLLVYRHGMMGAAASSVIYAVWQLSYFVPRFCRECLQAPASRWYRRSASFLAIGLLAYGVPWLAGWSLGQGLSFSGLVGGYLAGTVLFLIGGWFRIRPDLRMSMQDAVRSWRVGEIRP